MTDFDLAKLREIADPDPRQPSATSASPATPFGMQ